jgi:SNF2 family DNA or RNA helicase
MEQSVLAAEGRSVLLRTEDLRTARAQSIKGARDINLPSLKFWNYDACAAHPEPRVDCEYRACGGELFAHQRVGVMWLYVRQSGLLADLPGVGKTNQVLGLAALLKERGELTNRMLIVCQTPAVLQWLAEAQRWVPKLRSDAVYTGLTKKHRINKYVQDWDLMVVGYHMLLQDWKMLEKFEVGCLVIDDVDPLLNHETKTHQTLVRLAQNAERCVVLNATSIQTKLEQVHAALLPAGGFDVFGSLSQFERRYVRKELSREMTRSGRVYTREVITGYKNGEELRQKLGPLYLRRKYEDLTDIRMPTLMPPQHVWLELHPEQRKKYAELQQGVLRLKTEEGEKLRHAQALAKVTYGQQICAGLPALGEADGPQASVKLDWLLHQTQHSWADRKVVAFIKNLDLVAAAEQRFAAVGIETAKIWGRHANAQHRAAEIQRFWKDPKCRVLLGTSAIERSLNLQNANILVNVDTILNPARMHQLAGRIRRAGSAHSHIWVFNLFCRDTQEEKYLSVLQRRQGMADYTWGEESELYEALSPLELLSLITP